MTYARVVKFTAKDGTLHDSEDLARSHDQAQRRKQIKSAAVVEIVEVLDDKANNFDNLPETWLDKAGSKYPSKEEIAEVIFDNWIKISSICSPSR